MATDSSQSWMLSSSPNAPIGTIIPTNPNGVPLTKFHYFLSLPEELRYELYSYSFPHGSINITLPKRKNGKVPHYFKYFFRVEGIPLLTLNKQIFEECKDFLWTRNKFTSRDALSFSALPDVMGGAVEKIKHVELKNHFRMVVDSQQERWPKMMRLQSQNFKSLSTFELCTDFAQIQPPLAETSGTDRIRQEIRALARFGAFLVVCIPQLNFLVIQMPYNVPGRTFIRVEIMKEAPRLQDGEMLLNSRALRHTATWNELHDISIEHFEIDPKCPMSEMGSYGLLPKDMKKIDTIGYQTRGELYLKNIHVTPSVDSMIVAARKNMLDHERRVQEWRERKKNTETTLGRIVELFPKGLTLPVGDQKQARGRVQNGRGGTIQSKLDSTAHFNAPENTQRIIPSNVTGTRRTPASGGYSNRRGGWGNGRGRGGGHAAYGANSRGERSDARPPIADSQQVSLTPTTVGAAQGASVNDNGDWPALGALPSHRRR